MTRTVMVKSTSKSSATLWEEPLAAAAQHNLSAKLMEPKVTARPIRASTLVANIMASPLLQDTTSHLAMEAPLVRMSTTQPLLHQPTTTHKPILRALQECLHRHLYHMALPCLLPILQFKAKAMAKLEVLSRLLKTMQASWVQMPKAMWWLTIPSQCWAVIQAPSKKPDLQATKTSLTPLSFKACKIQFVQQDKILHPPCLVTQTTTSLNIRMPQQLQVLTGRILTQQSWDHPNLLRHKASISSQASSRLKSSTSLLVLAGLLLFHHKEELLQLTNRILDPPSQHKLKETTPNSSTTNLKAKPRLLLNLPTSLQAKLGLLQPRVAIHHLSSR